MRSIYLILTGENATPKLLSKNQIFRKHVFGTVIYIILMISFALNYTQIILLVQTGEYPRISEV